MLCSGVTRGGPGEILLGGKLFSGENYCKIGGYKKLKERGKAERAGGKELGNRGSIEGLRKGGTRACSSDYQTTMTTVRLGAHNSDIGALF